MLHIQLAEMIIQNISHILLHAIEFKNITDLFICYDNQIIQRMYRLSKMAYRSERCHYCLKFHYHLH